MIAAIEMMNVVGAALLMLGLACIFAIVLLIASIKLKVKVDPKVEQVHQALPNIDCGACGFAGCASYAKAVVADPQIIGRCSPGGADTSAKIGEILNLQISGGGAPLRPVIHCRACKGDKEYFSKYEGIIGCTSANAQPNVQACGFGCLGFGGCVRRCKFDAIHIINGLAVIDYDKCTGCGSCATGCPRNLIEMIPFTHENMMIVACSNQENGKTARSMCKVGCIGCKLCAKKSDLFQINNFLARMDYEKYQASEATKAASDKCPTGVIVLRGKNARSDRPAGQKPKPAAAKS